MTRRDRDGEPLEHDDTTTTTREHFCRSGWTGTDLDGRPIPCLICKPHLKRRSPYR